jgi:hypothetical protein
MSRRNGDRDPSVGLACGEIEVVGAGRDASGTKARVIVVRPWDVHVARLRS